ncbi:MAG: 50S ribosomal protein L32 [Candidatus Lloydbacteria bacterium]|nr:50S ribosomal protein L32 [Candidatus Lloydbacteria bacterium]
MSVRMRHTRAHTKNRRAHHALETPRLSACPKCGTAQLRHHMCDNCGHYRGRQVIDMAAKTAMRAKRQQEKLKSFGEIKKEEDGGKEKSLSAEVLSSKKKK